MTFVADTSENMMGGGGGQEKGRSRVSFHALLLDACIEETTLAAVKEIKRYWPAIVEASEMQQVCFRSAGSNLHFSLPHLEQQQIFL